MKRRRKEGCVSPILDESPKRIKVQAQRKFAQNSGIHNPIITPIRDLENTADLLPNTTNEIPEPIELLPMKRPNTEDFVTFLCYRGTPVLPQHLQFFNTASIVTDGQVHEIKGDSPKNGPIDITKCVSGSSEKPYIAFGVRKRADPVVIKKQMEKKRRHARVIQALRRGYQQQKMAKIRAFTISKLSEKTTNKTMVKTNTIQKTETVTKKTDTLQKTKVVATKHIKVTTETLKTSLKPKMKPRMCLRSFRGNFVHKELPFKAKKFIAQNEDVNNKKKSDSVKNLPEEKTDNKSGNLTLTRKTSNNNNESTTMKMKKSSSDRVTRSTVTSSDLVRSTINTRSSLQRPQLKRRILLSSTTTSTSPVVKPKLRSTTLKKTILSRKNAQQRSHSTIIKPKTGKASNNTSTDTSTSSNEGSRKTETTKKSTSDNNAKNEDIKKRLRQELQPSRIPKRITRNLEKKLPKKLTNKNVFKKEFTKNVELKKEVKIATTTNKKEIKRNSNLKKELNLRTNDKIIKKNVDVKKVLDTVTKRNDNGGQNTAKESKIVSEITVKKILAKKSLQEKLSQTTKDVNKKSPQQSLDTEQKTDSVGNKPKNQILEIKLEDIVKNSQPLIEKLPGIEIMNDKNNSPVETAIKDAKKKNEKTPPITNGKKDTLKKPKEDELEQLDEQGATNRSSATRPTRKTKEAATVYMDILCQQLVDDNQSDDNISIGSFPELPNAKRIEQRENELRAKATRKTAKAQTPTVEDEDKDTKIIKVIDEPCDDGKDDQLSVISVNSSETAGCIAQMPKLNELPSEDNENKSIVIKESPPKSSPTPSRKRSCSLEVISDSASDNEVLQKKLKKTTNTNDKVDSNANRRQTRSSTTLVVQDKGNNSSDELSRDDEKLSTKAKSKTSQSSKSVSVLETNVDMILEAARVLEEETLSEPDDQEIDQKSINGEKLVINENKMDVKNQPEVKLIDRTTKKKESDNGSDTNESGTSDMNLKSLQEKQRNKQITKTKLEQSFSDSDEEPLSRLTGKSVLTHQQKSSKRPITRRTADRSLAQNVLVVNEPKPKRECTKRPSNYLPMSSSGDEDDDDESDFHGFSKLKVAAVTSSGTTATAVISKCSELKHNLQPLAPSLDLLCKDNGRGKETAKKFEQIEQWLMDAALAGTSVATENDAMLKFGEPTLSNLRPEPTVSDLSNEPTVSDLKPEPIVSDLRPEPELVRPLKQDEEEKSSKNTEEISPKSDAKSPISDRKLIFKKAKQDVTPNKNAFSPDNECSVYAFGEDSEEVICTPFRRPSRRPSSTATSRSEEDLTKIEETAKQNQFRKPADSEDVRCFNIPQNLTKHPVPKSLKLEPMVPPSSSFHAKKPAKFEKFPEPFDDNKYKVPSSPSASSGSSIKLYKRAYNKQKGKITEIKPVYVSEFPKPNDAAKLVEAPVFYPTEQEFQEPLEYIERIRHKAEPFGICRIVPPNSFKSECKVLDDMRFTAYNQYVNKMLHRWGPNFKEFLAIKRYLATQNITLKTPPLIGGMEIDLPRLYQTVQSLGGLTDVIQKKKWSRVSDNMKIPKSAQDRVTKLDDIYCKYLLPYDTLSPIERERLFDEVEANWTKRQNANAIDAPNNEPENEGDGNEQEEEEEEEEDEEEDDEADECTIKGKNMALNAFYRVARNTMAMYFKVPEPTAHEVELEFWRYVIQRQNHICVHSASIDCGNWGYGFPVSKNSPIAKHPWNLKVLSNNAISVLRSLGPVMGVTVPTLHVGMVFSTCCWYRDPHGLPWIEYLHTGANKIWYGIPNSSCDLFHSAMQQLVPNYCRDKELWLPSDTAMVPPTLLMERNVSLCRTVQEPGQFLVVFPKVFTSSISTGYVVSESVYFAPLYWLKTATSLFNDLKTSCEPSMFSLDKLLVSICLDSRSSIDVLRVVQPFMEELNNKEKMHRATLRNLGITQTERINIPEVGSKKKKIQNVDGDDYECEICRTNLYLSMITDTQEDLIYCLEDAIDVINKLTDKTCQERFKLQYTHDETELESIINKVTVSIELKMQKTNI